jgi:hypothetical protein
MPDDTGARERLELPCGGNEKCRRNQLDGRHDSREHRDAMHNTAADVRILKGTQKYFSAMRLPPAG